MAKAHCNGGHRVRSEESCDDIKKGFSLSAGVFDQINPNLNCDNLFEGQWICTDGHA
ncbi:hypothetical protein HS088_TW12G00133 [Tripterygium wilfordii]|uniref:LysM domain-containing protein n=1 Tax=Tripterygium wilfordii TaxID=458696 RepID=A0A7J7CXU3_TRIWF|nr:hypothetical protein HS088_TW12G00133 [Tripterygium wilfordii]